MGRVNGETPGWIYLLHFEPAYKHARHYLGWTTAVEVRVDAHLNGAGSPLVKAAVAAGCEVTVVATWPGTRRDEAQLKARHDRVALCPECGKGRRARKAAALRRLRARRRQAGRNRTAPRRGERKLGGAR